MDSRLLFLPFNWLHRPNICFSYVTLCPVLYFVQITHYDIMFHLFSYKSYLGTSNHTFVGQFVLLGLTDDPAIQLYLFVLFMLMYTLTMVGNIGIIMLFVITPSLHNPMYFFLSHLSFTDLCYSSVITPKLMDILIIGNKAISYSGCMIQLVVFSIFGSLECLILAVMACDRCAAVCKPLFYHLIMTDAVCRRLIAGCYTSAISCSLLNASYALQLNFCSTKNIHHFYCDYPPLLKLACSDTSGNQIVLLASVSCVSGLSVLTILLSYGYIVYTVLRIKSTDGRSKVFYTCSSHLTVVSVFYGTILFMYLRPGAKYFSDQDKVAAVFYTVVIPILNPIIYSLRSRELQSAFHKFLGGINLTF
ncbi:olfactory receptor 1019-like [Bombina bombina]|uniref:olfactory receptor 1019-like n=1 Tax=Bombina bombina TaxID=8345 RepID=UPI00235AB864|nr:olfactory receptor 1019-like [Bombina bombina]